MKTAKQKKPNVTKLRKLQSGRTVSQFDREIPMTVSSMCPDKWLFVDMENGYVWHIREDEFSQKNNYHFWRGASKKELKELKQIRLS